MRATPPTSSRSRLWPFAGLAVLGWLLVRLPGAPVQVELWIASGLVTAAVAGAVARAPWARLPQSAQLIPALAYLGAVALLRQAGGGTASGAGSLVLLPVIWMALYGTRRQLVVVIAGVSAVWALPLLLIGGTAYPATGWRACVLSIALSTMIGTTVQRLVRRVRADADALRARNEERDRLLARLDALASSDPLTGLANRRAWDEGLGRALASTGGVPLSVVLLDLDAFKALNDRHGHQAGDDALVASARGWLAELRPGDLLARIGGDEFALLLQGCSSSGALDVVRRLELATAAGLSCSAGVAQWDGREPAQELQVRADRELYRSKRATRRPRPGPVLEAV